MSAGGCSEKPDLIMSLITTDMTLRLRPYAWSRNMPDLQSGFITACFLNMKKDSIG